MHELDLGEEVKIKVKYAGVEYQLREPTVDEIENFSKQDGDNKGMRAFSELLETIGMPKEVVGKMGMSKARMLVDGITDLLFKKK